MAAQTWPFAVSALPSLSAPEANPVFVCLDNERALPTASAISINVALMEPALYLQSYDQNHSSPTKLAILRGQMHLIVTKPVRINEISILFRGQTQTDWPGGMENIYPVKLSMLTYWLGIPLNRTHVHDKEDFLAYNVVFFRKGVISHVNNDYGAHHYSYSKELLPMSRQSSVKKKIWKLCSKSSSLVSLGHNQLADNNLAHGDQRYLSNGQLLPTSQTYVPWKGRVFPIGDYLYCFEFLVDGALPETIKTPMGFVRYDLQVIVERSGLLRPKILRQMEIPVLRLPDEDSSAQFDPIISSCNWKDQVYYDLVISGRSFPLGSHIPINLKFAQVAKAECHRVKIYVTENIQYWNLKKRMYRSYPRKQVLLMDKVIGLNHAKTSVRDSFCVVKGADVHTSDSTAAASEEMLVYNSWTNSFEGVEKESVDNLMEMNLSVPLPGCHEMKNRPHFRQLHVDARHQNIQVDHRIKARPQIYFFQLILLRSCSWIMLMAVWVSGCACFVPIWRSELPKRERCPDFHYLSVSYSIVSSFSF